MQGWRAMREEDLDTVTAISDVVHADFRESRETYAERLALYPAGCIVFERDGVVEGFLISHPWYRGAAPKLNQPLGTLPVKPDSFYLHDIALLPATRGSGAGRAALDYVIDHVSKTGFAEIALIAVNGADSYWRRQGFEIAVAAGENDTPLPNYGPGSYYMRRAVRT